MNSRHLLAMPLKELRKYINAYNLPAKAAIEKNDLVKIIINTRPISDESEIFYRSHRQPPPPPLSSTNSTEQGSRHHHHNNTSEQQPSSLSQFLSDIFGGNKATTASNDQRRQQQQQEQQRQQQQQRPPRPAPTPTPTATPASDARSNTSPAATRKDDTLSLDDLIRSNIDPASLSVRTLKSILRTNFVEQSHAVEKSELVLRVKRLAEERKRELSAREGASGISDDSLCRICCDAQQNCVFLDCGHMVACMECAKEVSCNELK